MKFLSFYFHYQIILLITINSESQCTLILTKLSRNSACLRNFSVQYIQRFWSKLNTRKNFKKYQKILRIFFIYEIFLKIELFSYIYIAKLLVQSNITIFFFYQNVKYLQESLHLFINSIYKPPANNTPEINKEKKNRLIILREEIKIKNTVTVTSSNTQNLTSRQIKPPGESRSTTHQYGGERAIFI